MKSATALVLALLATGAQAAPEKILFVGNSYTFGRVDPVMSYNAGNVDDLTRPRPDLPDPNFTETTGTRPWEPHPWGGVPGIFKQLADQAGVEVEVSLSTRNAASLRGHFLNTANPDWDLRGNIAKQKWDVVVLQEQSDASLPRTRGDNANNPQFSLYVDKIERFVHAGDLHEYRERVEYIARYGSVAACNNEVSPTATSSCNNNTLRQIPANPNANPDAKVFLTQTWARPDMVFPHLSTVADANYPTVPDGRPIVETTAAFPNGYPDTLYYTEAEGLAAMTADLRAAAAARLAANPNLAGVIPVGDAFQRAVDDGIAKGDGFYNAEGTYAEEVPSDKLNLWWIDYLHASKYGSYLSALVTFGKLTGISPASFGASEQAASDLGINPGDAVRLQRVATDQLVAAGASLEWIPCLRANPNANGAGPGNRNVVVCGSGQR